MFTTCGSSPWEVEKANTQARLLSGRYGVEALSGHWVPWNKEGMCVLPGCWRTQHSHKGTVENMLLSCFSLSPTRLKLVQFTILFLHANPHLTQLVHGCLDSDPIQFWLDPSTIAVVISAVQSQGEDILSGLFKLTRNYCHGLHKARVGMLETE